MSHPREEEFSEAVAEYTGKEVIDIDVISDSQIEGAYAARVKVSGVMGYLYFIHCVNAEDEITWLSLEEAEFSEWPPIEGDPRFFM